MSGDDRSPRLGSMRADRGGVAAVVSHDSRAGRMPSIRSGLLLGSLVSRGLPQRSVRQSVSLPTVAEYNWDWLPVRRSRQVDSLHSDRRLPRSPAVCGTETRSHIRR
jgi:hypothetical protein